MKKKTGIITSLLLLFLLIYSCEQDDQIETYKTVSSEIESDKDSNDPLNILKDRRERDCDGTIQTDLIAGQHTTVGKVLMTKEGDLLKITYDLSTTDWWLKETHLFAGSIDEATFGPTGNPKIGHFTYHGDHDLVKKYSFSIPFKDQDECFSIITHASVVLVSDTNETASETAFGLGDTEFSGNRWGWYFDVCESDCFDNQEFDDESSESDDVDEAADSYNDNEDSDNPETNNPDESNGCMDAYAYSNRMNSTCFLNDFSTWGWSNKVIANNTHYMPGGVTYTYPMYASAYDCAIENSILIGEISINVAGGDSVLYGSLTVTLSRQELSITDLHIFADETIYPLDNSGNPTIAFESFDVDLNSMNEKTYTVNWLDWFDETNFIVHVSVCPEEIVQ